MLKLHFGKLTAKIYAKGEHVLRIEIMVQNARALACGVSLGKFVEIFSRLKEILNRFLSALRCVDRATIGAPDLDELAAPAQVGRTRVGGLDIQKVRTRTVIEAILALAPAPRGFRCADVVGTVRTIGGATANTYTARQDVYDLKKLRGKNAVRKVDHSQRYEAVPEGLRNVATVFILREKVIKLVLAGAGKPRLGRPPKAPSALDVHYATLHAEMRELFQLIGIVA